MGTYTLELELFSSYVTDVPEFEIWADGVLLGSSYSVTSGGFSISVTPSYGGALPTSLEFRFNDASIETPRSIEVRSVKINDKYVNVRNYLSSDNLTNGQTSVVDVPNANFLFDDSEPAGSLFTTSTTQTFTTGIDFHNNYGGTTNETFDMLAGSDYAHTGSGDDTLSGGAGNDTLRGGAGNDLLYGGTDNDRLYGMNDDDTLYGGLGNDTLHGNGGNDQLFGNDGDDRLVGHAGDDILVGGIGADKLNGGSGADQLFGDADNDQLIGGAGNDTLDGGDGDDVIYGGRDDDILNGGDGADILIGNIGVDTINGDAGNDTIYVMLNDWSAGERIYGGTGIDELIITRGSTIDFTTGVIDELETLTGSDDAQDLTYTIEQVLQFTNIDLGGGTDNSRVNISGTVDATALGTPTVLNAENGFLTGSTGNDDLTITSAQLDALIYGAGIIDFDTGTDVIRIDATSTELNLLGATDASILGLEEIDASSSVTNTTIDLSGQTEDLIVRTGALGTATVNTVTMGSGNDVVYGLNGQDIITLGDGNDNADGGIWHDIINGGNGNDTILGGSGDDTIDGGAGNDTIYGDRGDGGIPTNSNDIITGGIGADALYGEAGNDIFNLANGDFGIGEIIDGDSIDETTGDEIVLTNATTVDFTTGTVTEVETLTGSSGDDDVTMEISLVSQFTTIDLGAHATGDTMRIQIDGTYDAVANGVPTVTNVENGFLVGSANADTLTAGEAELSAFIYGNGTINMAASTDTLNLTETSTTLNTLGITDGSIQGLEVINASTSVNAVTINLSGQSDDFNITGSDFAGFVDNNAIEFQAGDDTVSLAGLGVNTATNSKTTVEFWMDWDGTNNVMPFGFNTYDLWFSNGFFGFNNNSSLIYGISSTDLINTPVHIAAVFTDSNVLDNTLYINGVEQTLTVLQGSVNNAVAQVTSNARISGWGANAAFKFDGTIDEVRIWDGERTQTEIISNMNRQITGPEANLIANYNFEDVTDGAGGVTDTSGNGNNGTLGGITAAGSIIVRNDILDLSVTDDIITTGSGNDTIDGGAGNDTLNGAAGNDIIDGGTGNDTIDGGAGDDVLTGGVAGANITTSITIANPGFEAIVLGNGGFTGSATSWVGVGGAGTYNPPVGSYAVEAPEGQNIAYIDGTSFSQTLGETLEANTIYTLSAFVGNAGHVGGGPTYSISLYSGSTLLGSSSDAYLALDGIWRHDSLTIDSSGFAGDIGSALRIELLKTGGTQVNFDDVRLTKTESSGQDVLLGGAGNDTIYSTDAAGATVDKVADILAANAGVVYNESTGNFYQYITTNVDYATAEFAATSALINNIGGHLVNIGSAGEQTFVYDLTQTNTGTDYAWIGASDRAVEGEWRWQGGEEAGTQFWQGNQTGTNVGGQYSNWFNTNPQGGTAENVAALVVNLNPTADTFWADQSQTTTNGYVIEWEGDAVLGTSGSNTLSGGDGSDVLYGTDGMQDIFDFNVGESGIDIINNFTAADTDAIDISDLLTGYTAGVSDINDFVQFTNSGANSLIQIDANGITGGASFTTIGQINGVNDLDTDALLYNSSII